MSEQNNNDTSLEVTKTLGSSGISRRSFLKYAGASAAAITTFGIVGCNSDSNGTNTNKTVNVGSGDVGVLNYAYALEQLEAAFYIQVSQQSNFSGEAGQIFEDLRTHEVTHRDFLKAAITSIAADQIIPALTPDFSSIDFSDQNNVLSVAQTLEDTGVSAYNGAAQLIQDTDYLGVAGKIVSVEARHAAAIRDLQNPKSASFAGDDIVDADTGLGAFDTPQNVAAAASTFIKETLDASQLQLTFNPNG